MPSWKHFSITHRYTQLPQSLFSYVSIQPLDDTSLVIWNDTLAKSFALPEKTMLPDTMLAELFGEKASSSFQPLAMKYAGHQFGSYNPELGDGRGLLLGEIQSDSGTVFDLHLKGAGLTPYSRMGDGRAVLRSTIREYLCSEAMAGLNIPTTRALAMVDSRTPVYREKTESGAMLIRMTESHIRFGHFEHLFYTNQLAEQKRLADKVIEWHFPQCSDSDNPYAAMFNQIVDRTASMIAHWQAVGFAHGVMNTDNMSILGQTFDFGPFGFLDDYDPGYICNHSDYQGRYAFDQQPRIALWNLSALAHALSSLVERGDLEDALSQFESQLSVYFSRIMRDKLGLLRKQEEDAALFDSMFELLRLNSTDYTRFFRQLSELDRTDHQTVVDLFIDRPSAQEWIERYITRCAKEHNEEGQEISASIRCERMRQHNPKYVLRNYLAQLAIDKAEQGDYSDIETLATLLASPFDEHIGFEHYAALPPEWGKSLEISCSS